MITIKSFFRKKVTKIYLTILIILITILLMLNALITYFSNIQNKIFSDFSELVVMDDKDIYNDLLKFKEIRNIKRRLAFRENKEYDVFVPYGYEIYDSDGNLIDSYHNNEDKLTWNVIEQAQLEDYILVTADAKNEYNLNNDEIVIGIKDFWYESYDISYFNDILNKKIGFIFNDNNIEFTIKNVIPTNSPILIISQDFYNDLMSKTDLYAYTAELNSMRHQKELMNKLNSIKNSSYPTSIITFYKNDASDTVSSLYDLIDVLNLASYIAIVIFFIILLIIIINTINDFKENMLLQRKLGFTKFQIKIDVLKNIGLLYILATILAIISFIILIYILKFTIKINLFLLDFYSIFKIIGFGFLLIIFLTIVSTTKHLKSLKN